MYFSPSPSPAPAKDVKEKVNYLYTHYNIKPIKNATVTLGSSHKNDLNVDLFPEVLDDDKAKKNLKAIKHLQKLEDSSAKKNFMLR